MHLIAHCRSSNQVGARGDYKYEGDPRLREDDGLGAALSRLSELIKLYCE